MTFILTGLLFVIFVAVVASLYTDGMWGNAITLVNVVTAALLATNFFEPLANWLDGMRDLKAYTYIWDFLSVWVLFAFFMGVMRALTDAASRVKVRFLKIADQIGGIVFACLVGAVVVCFTTFTLHTAPLSKNFLFGGFQPDAPMLLGMSPDRAWLQFTRSVSKRALSRSPEAAFDPHGQLRGKYAVRRGEIETQVKAKGSIRKQ
jgi:uncharacterized membrane protein required for colicin V production